MNFDHQWNPDFMGVDTDGKLVQCKKCQKCGGRLGVEIIFVDDPFHPTELVFLPFPGEECLPRTVEYIMNS